MFVADEWQPAVIAAVKYEHRKAAGPTKHMRNLFPGNRVHCLCKQVFDYVLPGD